MKLAPAIQVTTRVKISHIHPMLIYFKCVFHTRCLVSQYLNLQDHVIDQSCTPRIHKRTHVPLRNLFQLNITYTTAKKIENTKQTFSHDSTISCIRFYNTKRLLKYGWQQTRLHKALRYLRKHLIEKRFLTIQVCLSRHTPSLPS